MGLHLEQVVPWGRSLAEYTGMFALGTAELNQKLLDCGGGPASFNAELTQQGGHVVSCDPIYQFTKAEIAQQIRATYGVILNGVRQHLDCYVWREIPSPEALGKVRMTAMKQFLADFETGLQANRYQVAALPHLPFANQTFELALCSHLLFTYTQQLSLNFHVSALAELCRVATEVRIFPLLQLSGEPSPHLAAAIAQCQLWGLDTEIVTVPYEFQRGGNQMLRIRQSRKRFIR
ncbi:SAM-dependent methyltransferase [Almyronema epifaneia]|uniref:SAM-dependent methyltransferase n=1 Tax=Almyronema epifaneia S1 TaxID=2991925 RepID=A0ABW6IDW7_9CYAN